MGSVCAICASDELVLDSISRNRLKRTMTSKILKAHLPKEFCHQFVEGPYTQLLSQTANLLREADIEPIDEVAKYHSLYTSDEALFKKVVIIKLNGGLGVSMGMDGPKSLIAVDGSQTFLDLTVLQYLDIPAKNRGKFYLLNSFATSASTMRFLDKYNMDSAVELLQNKTPKIDTKTYEPVTHSADSTLEWAPPGSGDVFAALASDNRIQSLLDEGYEYAFISNADNLVATLDEKIIAYFHKSGKGMLMEVCERKAPNRKKEGGHLCMLNNRLAIRRESQVPSGEEDHYADIDKHKYFNTGNYWVNLRELLSIVKESRLRLPLNLKTKPIDPVDPDSTEVYYAEVNAGDAIGLFSDSGLILVPQSRYLPVKYIEDLLLLRSDAYTVEDYVPHLSHYYSAKPVVELDPKHYKNLDDLAKLVPDGIPSICETETLTILGRVTFEADTYIQGKVRIENSTGETVQIGGTLSNDTYKFPS